MKLSPDKTYYVGTHYEYTAALALMRLGFSLLRVGRKKDAGIDLIGHWVLAPLREPLPVIIQCKVRKISVTPSHVREMEGSFQGIPADWRNKDVLGLLVSTMKATKGVLEVLRQSRWPMGYVLVSREGTVEQFVWNPVASEKGLEGVGVTVRHTPRSLLSEVELKQKEEGDPPMKSTKRLAKFRNTGTKKDIQLTWMGSPIFADRENLDQATVKLMSVVSACENMGKSTARSKKSAVLDRRSAVVHVPGQRGRPKGSRTLPSSKAPVPRGGQIPKQRSGKVETRGRPKGSKNKPKIPVDTG